MTSVKSLKFQKHPAVWFTLSTHTCEHTHADTHAHTHIFLFCSTQVSSRSITGVTEPQPPSKHSLQSVSAALWLPLNSKHAYIETPLNSGRQGVFHTSRYFVDFVQSSSKGSARGICSSDLA